MYHLQLLGGAFWDRIPGWGNTSGLGGKVQQYRKEAIINQKTGQLNIKYLHPPVCLPLSFQQQLKISAFILILDNTFGKFTGNTHGHTY